MIKGKAWLLVISVVIAAVSACSKNEPSDTTEASVAKAGLKIATNDERQYQTLILENGLRVLLISDESTPKAAVSLNVDVGSGADPVGREGLAHFVEHMLFLGTEKFPEAGEYQEFITEKGGSHNAYTAFEDTNYFFDIEPDALAPALDRFSQFFIAPLFTDKYLERERLAVHSEYKARIDNPMRRMLDVFKQVINPAHPYSKFSVGTQETLKTEGLAAAVKTFYQQNYFAENMSLVVLGAQPLAELEKLVTADFAEVPAKAILAGAPARLIEHPLFLANGLPMIVELQSKQDSRSLSVNFPLPDLEQDKLEKNIQLISHLLGHEGEGSLFAYLKKQGWVEALSSGLFLNYPGGAMFSVNVQLSPSGFERKQQVLQQVFATIGLIAQQGIEVWRYDEMSKVSMLEFNFQPKAAAQSYVRSIAAGMDEYALPYWLSGGFEMRAFDQALLKSLLTKLRPDNSFIMLTSPDYDFETRSPWYDVPYQKTQPTPQQLQAWQDAKPDQSITLPAVNRFVPDDLSLHRSDVTFKPLREEAGVSVWFYQADAIEEPRAFSKVSLSNADVEMTASRSVVNRVAARLINDSVNKALYEAKAIGYSASVGANAFGINAVVYGYDEKLAAIAEVVVDQVKTVNWTEAEYLRVKDQLLRGWANAALQSPYKQLGGVLSADLLSPAWLKEQSIAALTPMSFSEFLSLWQSNQSFTNLTALVSGNVSDQSQQAMLDQWLRLKPRVDEPTARPRLAVKALSSGELTVPYATAGADAAVLRYVRSPIVGYEGRALTALTAQILESGFYHSLRTEQQFGYIVYMANRLLQTTPGLMMLVQSPRYDEAEINGAIDKYLSETRVVQQDIDEATFESFKAAMKNSLLKPPTNVFEAGNMAWRNLMHDVHQFDEAQRVAQALEEIDLATWKNFVEKLFETDAKMQVTYETAREASNK